MENEKLPTYLVYEIIYNSGVQVTHEVEIVEEDKRNYTTIEDFNSHIEMVQNSINTCYKHGLNGFLKFQNKEGKAVSINLAQTSQVTIQAK